MKKKGVGKKYTEMCKVPSCDRMYVAKGYCHAHYTRWRLGYLEEDMQKPFDRQGKKVQSGETKEGGYDPHWWARGTIFIPEDMKTDADYAVMAENRNRCLSLDRRKSAVVDGGYEEQDTRSGKVAMR